MNIYAIKGFKVKFTGEGGYDKEREWAKELLEEGKEYTIDHTDVGQSSTSIFLQEIPLAPSGRPLGLNSVMFEDVVPQSEEDDKKHQDYKMWHESFKK